MEVAHDPTSREVGAKLHGQGQFNPVTLPYQLGVPTDEPADLKDILTQHREEAVHMNLIPCILVFFGFLAATVAFGMDPLQEEKDSRRFGSLRMARRSLPCKMGTCMPLRVYVSAH